MSNRRRVRSDHVLEVYLVAGSPADALRAGLAYRCPDCSSEVAPIATNGDVLARVEVQHDDTCPWLRARTA